ncbi:MAG TPA: SAM-dependent methyltransferase [Cyanobacteria bacterium UBA12227]|nr:SAM-dependent methyltransferase [Cyanobacteria bacterium UBA12227]
MPPANPADSTLPFNNFKALPNPQIAAQLKDAAFQLSPEIDRLKNSAISQQRPTLRRARIAEAMYQRGIALERIQCWLNALAKEHESGDISQCLYQVRSKSALIILAEMLSWQASEITDFFASNHPDDIKKRRSLHRCGITSPRLLSEAIAHLNQLAIKPHDSRILEIRRAENDLVGRRIPGYFPSPQEVVNLIIKHANLLPGLRVLEPSAGNGELATGIREAGCEPDVIEIDFHLQQILLLKQFNIIATDFLKFHPIDPQWDRILMNPPFDEEITHIQHAYSLLAPNGLLISVISNSVNSNTKSKKYRQFRDWLESVDATTYQLPDGVFLKSRIRTTGVKTQLLILATHSLVPD